MSKPPCGVWPPTLSLLRVEPVAERRDERAAVLVQHLLHFPDVGLRLASSVSARRRRAAWSNFGVLPVRLVPRRVRRRRRRRASASPRRGRPSSSSTNGALQPHVVPEPVGRLLLDLDLDAGLAAALAWNSVAMSTAPLNAASEACSTIGGSAMPDFFKWNSALSGSYLRLRQFGVEVGIGPRNRVIVAERAVAAEQRLEDLLAIDGVFQREAEVGVVVGVACRSASPRSCASRRARARASIFGVFDSSATALDRRG